jgi:hypothetical protein
MLQTELARVGCYTGAVNGEWNTPAQRALESFNKNARTKLDPKKANLEALDAVRDRDARVCPIECERNFKADGEKCVRVACDSGFALNDKGICDPVKGRNRETKRTQPEPQQRRQAAPAQAQRGRGGGSGQPQYACDRFSCRPVPKGCSVRTSSFRDQTEQTVICN